MNMFRTALVIVLSLTPAEQLTMRLRGAKEITVEYTVDGAVKPNRTVTLKNPAKLLQSLTVIQVLRGAVDTQDAPCHLRFGSSSTVFWLVDGGEIEVQPELLYDHDATLLVDVAKGFTDALNKASRSM
jgi:hypothetical protein